MNTPLVTVGITCYNASDTIARALESALRQDWNNTEIIVVDDVSTDQSVEIIESIMQSEPRIRLVRHGINKGPAGARNTILENARGEYVIFFDDDDESEPNRITVQYKVLNEYELKTGARLVACYASGVRKYGNGYELKLQAIGTCKEVPRGQVLVDYVLLNVRNDNVFYGAGIPTCALMARLATFQSVGGFDNDLRRVEDADFAIRLAFAGGHFIGTSDSLFVQHATQAADKSPHANMLSELKLVEKYAAYLRSKGRYAYARNWFKIRYYHFSGQHFRCALAILAFILRNPVSGIRHIARSLPSRLKHERGMRSGADIPL